MTTTIGRAPNMPEGGTLPNVRFARHTDTIGKAYTLHDLMAMNAADGMLFARGEDSGCDGSYCEVAIWNEKTHRWERIAFEKFFGGEIEHDGAPLSAEECAAYCARLINGASSAWNRDNPALVHSMPSYGSPTAPADLLQAGWAIVEEMNRGKRVDAYTGQAAILADKLQRLADLLTKHAGTATAS